MATRSGVSRGVGSAGVRVGTLLVFGVIPAAFTVVLFAAGGRAFAYDFHQAFWPAGRDVLHGASPYVDPASPDVAGRIAFIYPAVAALLFAPFALLSRATGDQVFAALNILAAIGMLRVLAVRDWRLYGLVLLSPSVFYAWHLANVTLPIALGIAAMWRWRDRPVVAGLLVAVLVSVKMFVWPLGLWLLATRRYAAFAWALGAGVVLNAAAWLVLGFDEIPRYQALLRASATVQERASYSLIAVASDLGAGHGAAYALMLAVAGLLALWCVTLGRAGRERQALALCIALGLAASPIVWLGYFSLLIVPLAVIRPRLSPAWLLLLPMWACPMSDQAGWQTAVVLASAVTLVAVLVPRQAVTMKRVVAAGGAAVDL